MLEANVREREKRERMKNNSEDIMKENEKLSQGCYHTNEEISLFFFYCSTTINSSSSANGRSLNS